MQGRGLPAPLRDIGIIEKKGKKSFRFSFFIPTFAGNKGVPHRTG